MHVFGENAVGQCRNEMELKWSHMCSHFQGRNGSMDGVDANGSCLILKSEFNLASIEARLQRYITCIVGVYDGCDCHYTPDIVSACQMMKLSHW